MSEKVIIRGLLDNGGKFGQSIDADCGDLNVCIA
jgi:hypothetical protein